MEESADGRFRVRDGFGIVGGVAVLVAAVAVVLLILGVWRRLAHETLPVLLDLPGGSWTVGPVLALVSVLGCISGWALLSLGADGAGRPGRLMRVARLVGCAGCWVAAVGPLSLLASGIPGRHCRSSEPECTYVPGSGTALLVYLGSAALIGWLWYRRRQSVVEARQARERERLRRLRKKGKGKSRAAARQR
ncbi:hypothetical protein [Streptomyces sp. NPDC000851]